MTELIVVSNRLPVHLASGRKEWERSSGGLAVALDRVLCEQGGTWVGWRGGRGTKPLPNAPSPTVAPPMSAAAAVPMSANRGQRRGEDGGVVARVAVAVAVAVGVAVAVFMICSISSAARGPPAG